MPPAAALCHAASRAYAPRQPAGPARPPPRFPSVAAGPAAQRRPSSPSRSSPQRRRMAPSAHRFTLLRARRTRPVRAQPQGTPRSQRTPAPAPWVRKLTDWYHGTRRFCFGRGGPQGGDFTRLPCRRRCRRRDEGRLWPRCSCRAWAWRRRAPYAARALTGTTWTRSSASAGATRSQPTRTASGAR